MGEKVNGYKSGKYNTINWLVYSKW